MDPIYVSFGYFFMVSATDLLNTDKLDDVSPSNEESIIFYQSMRVKLGHDSVWYDTVAQLSIMNLGKTVYEKKKENRVSFWPFVIFITQSSISFWSSN